MLFMKKAMRTWVKMKRSNAKMMSRPPCLFSNSTTPWSFHCPLPLLQEPTAEVSFSRIGKGMRTRAPAATVSSESEEDDDSEKESKANQSNSAEKERGTNTKGKISMCVIGIYVHVARIYV